MRIALLPEPQAELTLSAPVVLIGRGIDEGTARLRVARHQRQIQAPIQQLAAYVLQRGGPAVATAMTLAEDDALPHARLDLFVVLSIAQTQLEAIGPGLALQAELGDHRLIMIGIVEALHVLHTV